jgi:sugar O-acyltransferase (sialic acid O-acetyltransferase NeuD family)
MSRRSLIFGAGGHAQVIASFLEGDVRFLVEGSAAGGDQIAQSDFFARIDDFRDCPIYIGVGRNEARASIFDKLASFGVAPAVAIAPNAFVARNAEISAGAVICAGAVIGARARIGANTIVNTLSSVDHDCTLGDHSQITAGVTVGGTVTVGKNCFFGIKSAVIPNLSIGDNVVVMAGAVVVRDVPNSVMVGGSPARIVREL